MCQGTKHLMLLFSGFVNILLYALGYWLAEKTDLLSKLLPWVRLFLNGDFSLYTALCATEAYQYLQKMMAFVNRHSVKLWFYKVTCLQVCQNVQGKQKNYHLRPSIFKMSLPATVRTQFYKFCFFLVWLDSLFSNANWLIFKEKRDFQLLMALAAISVLLHGTAVTFIRSKQMNSPALNS